MGSSLISRECTGVSGGRCKGGCVETPELPGPLLREGKVETGWVPTARHPGPGSRADKSKCSSTCSLSPRAFRLPIGPAAPDSSSPEERESRYILGSGVTATCLRVRTPGWGPKALVERWAPRALTALPARHLSSLLSEGLPHDHRGWPLGLQTLPGPRRRVDPG